MWALLLAPTAFIAKARNRLVVTTLLFGIGLVLLRLHAIHTLPSELQGADNFEITVQSDPIEIAPRVRGSYLTANSYTFTATLNRFGDIRTHLPVRIFLSTNQSVTPSEVFKGYGRFTPSKDEAVAGTISVATLARAREANWQNRVAAKIRNDFAGVARSFHSEAANLVPGMVLGDTSGENSSFVNAMQRSGLTHLTAVSGENFAIIALAVLWLLQWPFPRNLLLRNIAVGILLAGFLVIVRPSPSVLRAATMTAIFLIGRTRGSKSQSLNSLGLAIIVLIALNPFEARSFGFALSVCATAGIILFSERIQIRLLPMVKSAFFAEALSIPLSATLLCTPVIVLLSGQISLTSLPANIAAAFAVTPITIIGLLSALVTPIFPLLGTALFQATLPFAWWVTSVAHMASTPPVISLPANLIGALTPIAIGALIYKRMWRTWSVLVVLFVLGHFLSNQQWPGKDWRIVNCDVGQGDGMVIKIENHSAIVVDVGPDPKAMDSCLHRLGISRIPLLVLTHFHADHVTGLQSVIKNRQIDEAWITHEHEPSMEYQSVMSSLAAVRILEPSQGESFRIGKNISIDVVWPRADPLPPSANPDGSEINNESIALVIHDGPIMLFAGGDIESESQTQIAELKNLPQVDILKVAHHGSRNQSMALLDRLSPAVAFISVGKGNMYGHPAPTLLRELTARGMAVYRTDIDGALAFDSRLRERSLRRPWWSFGLD